LSSDLGYDSDHTLRGRVESSGFPCLGRLSVEYLVVYNYTFYVAYVYNYTFYVIYVYNYTFYVTYVYNCTFYVTYFRAGQ